MLENWYSEKKFRNKFKRRRNPRYLRESKQWNIYRGLATGKGIQSDTGHIFLCCLDMVYIYKDLPYILEHLHSSNSMTMYLTVYT